MEKTRKKIKLLTRKPLVSQCECVEIDAPVVDCGVHEIEDGDGNVTIVNALEDMRKYNREMFELSNLQAAGVQPSEIRLKVGDAFHLINTAHDIIGHSYAEMSKQFESNVEPVKNE